MEHELWGVENGETKTYDWLTLHCVIGALKKVKASSTLICSTSCSDKCHLLPLKMTYSLLLCRR